MFNQGPYMPQKWDKSLIQIKSLIKLLHGIFSYTTVNFVSDGICDNCSHNHRKFLLEENLAWLEHGCFEKKKILVRKGSRNADDTTGLVCHKCHFLLNKLKTVHYV